MGLEILVADDDFLSYVPRFKKAFDGKVNFTAVDNGGEALRLVQKNNYDAVVLDYEMTPNGYQTAFKIRSLTENVKIIGFSAEWTKEMAEQLGMVYFSGVEVNIAQAIAKLAGMDRQSYERDIKPHFPC